MEMKGQRHHGHYGTGFSDSLEPLEPLDLSKCNSINDLVTAMKKTSFQARTVGEAADVLEAMASHRPYRPAIGIDKALAEIVQGRGGTYDPATVDACVKLFREKGFAFAT